MHNFQIPIVMPRPIEPSPLPDWQTFIRFIDALVPASLLLQLHDALLDELALAFFRVGQLGPVLGPKGRGFEEPVPAHDAADLFQRVGDLVNETFGPAALDEVRHFFLEAVVEGERVDDGGLAAGARRGLAEEDQVGGMRGRDGIFVVPADEMAWRAPAFSQSDMLLWNTVAHSFNLNGKGGEVVSLLIRSQHVLSLRPSQHLHTHVFVRDPGMWTFTRQTVQEFGEVIRRLEVETFQVNDAAV